MAIGQQQKAKHKKMDNITEKDVAIIIPLFLRESITEAEKISLEHLKTHLGKYDKFFVAAKKLKLNQFSLDGFKVKKFPNKFFGSIEAYIKLTSDTKFYEAFNDYKFIFIYHLDALVFSDQLLYWCKKNYDYIAAPWLAEEFKWLDESMVGNSGFCIRKVETFIKLYSSKKQWLSPEEFAIKTCKRVYNPFLSKIVYPFAKAAAKIKFLNNLKMHIKFVISQGKAEDLFVSRYGKHYLPEINISPVEDGLKFAFEVNPRKCFELNGNKMPFGCHAFEFFDYSFWEPHLLRPKE